MGWLVYWQSEVKYRLNRGKHDLYLGARESNVTVVVIVTRVVMATRSLLSVYKT